MFHGWKAIIVAALAFLACVVPVQAVQVEAADTAEAANSANTGSAAGLFQEIERIIDSRLTIGEPPVGNELENARRFLAGTSAGETGEELRRRIGIERLASIEKDFGLKLTGSYATNLKNGVIDEARDTLDSSSYLGLEWELLKDGYFGGGTEKERLRGEIRLAEVLARRAAVDESFGRSYYRAIYLFNLAKMRMLQERLDELGRYIEITRKLGHYRLFQWEDVIRLEQEKASVQTMLRNYLNFNRTFAPTPEMELPDAAKDLPVLDIDIGALLGDAEKDPFYGDVIDAEKQRLKRPDNYLLAETNLRVFARYNMDNLFAGGMRDSVAAGVSIRVPIPASGRDYSKIGDIEERLAELNAEKRREADLNRLRDAYYEYQYKMSDYLKLAHKKRLIGERIRREDVRRGYDDPLYSPLNMMQYLDEQFAVEFESVEVKQMLYLKLLEIQRISGGEAVFDHVAVVKNPGEPERYRGERSIYVWSAAVNGIDTGFLAMYLAHQEMRGVMLSIGEKTDTGRLSALLAKARESGMKTDALAGSNELVRPANHAKLAQIAEQAHSLGFDGVHLDVEPHTLPEWREKKDELLAAFIAMLKAAREATSAAKLELGVSIPVFFPEETLRQIASLADRIYVMAYEITDIEKLKRKVREEIDAFGPKTVIAIRTKDFANRLEMEEFIGKVIDATGVSRVAVHDMQGLIELDEKSMNEALPLQRRQ
ncbi:MAG: hypothetical protein HZA20_09630 [Nitrospirae bacterium]|nr:hypothetical protein [Nitrospirota bacterium]